MELYNFYFVAFVLVNAALAYRRNRVDKSVGHQESLALPSGDGRTAAVKFKWEYFSVYGLVVAADWLQGPYLYTLYKDQKGNPESVVAALITTGFVTAGITASFVGTLADRHGRKLACLCYCVSYTISCLSVLSDGTFVLFIGRAFGGLSTTLQYTVFETWMISEYHKRDLSDCLALGDMFSLSLTVSSILAIISGVIGEAIVSYTGTKTSPFMVAVVLLGTAFAMMHHKWSENYGETESEKWQGVESLRDILCDKRILALGLNTTLFEGSMYLFVFFWSPAIISSRSLAGDSSPPPFGVIFSCFMCAMMLGSFIFSSIKPESVRDAATLMLSVLALATYGFLIPILQRSEHITFWSFALFEVCVGLYFPTMSRLKSEIVEDAIRGKVYGLMRLPLNVFVVAALSATREGDAHRSRVFTAIGALLLSAFVVVQRYLL